MELVLLEELHKQVTHILPHRLDSLLQRRALVHDDVLQMRLERSRQPRRSVFREAQPLHLAVDLVAADGGVGSTQRQAQHLGPAGDAVHLGDVQLVVGDLAALDGLEGLLHLRLDGDVALERDGADPLDHLLADGLAVGAGGHHALDGPVAQLAQLDEAHLGALHARVLDPGTQLDRLAEVRLAVGFEGDLGGGESDYIAVAVVVLGLVLGVGTGLRSGLLGLLLGRAFGLLGLLLCFGLGLLEGLLGGACLALSTLGALCRGLLGGLLGGRLLVGHGGCSIGQVSGE